MGILYELYLEDSITEAINEMRKYRNEPDDEFNEATDKSSVYKENYYFRDNLQIPYVSNVLSKRKNRDALVAFVSKFINDHYYQLSAPGPIHMFTFGDTETNFLYELFGVNGDQLLEMYNKMVEEAFFGNISKFYTGFVKNAPHKILLTAILIEALQKDYQDIVECCEYLWAFCEYPIIFRIYWKTGVREDVMLYTIEHLGNKFKIKKLNNLQALLKYEASSSVEFKKNELITGADHTYTNFMQRMRSQMNNTFKNISKAYYDNIDSNATQHTTTSIFDDGTIADQDGHITNIAQAVEKTINKFSIGEINVSIARMTADYSQVDKDNLIGYLNQIISSKDNKLSKLVENIITAYFNKNPTNTSLGSSEFINFGLSMYRSIGTSKDQIYQEVKAILAMWMNDIINIRKTYNREATIISYTRAIYNYIIFMINHYN